MERKYESKRKKEKKSRKESKRKREELRESGRNKNVRNDRAQVGCV
jgi:hypothetical protein